MTDTHVDAALQRGAERARDDRGHRTLWLLLGVMMLAIVLLGVAFFGARDASRARNADRDRTIAALSQQAADNARDARALAEQVQRLGGTPVVQPDPAAEPRPARGIKGTAIDRGHLLVAYTDGATEDKGPVVGAAGADGQPGRGIVGSTITDGRLLLAYSDRTTEDAGPIVGPPGAPGRGIAAAAIVDGRLVLTYTDGTTQDLGPLPVGRGITRTEVRDCRLYVTYTDGTTEDAGPTCTTQTQTETQTRTVTPTTTARPAPPPSSAGPPPLLPS